MPPRGRLHWHLMWPVREMMILLHIEIASRLWMQSHGDRGGRVDQQGNGIPFFL